MGRGELLAVQGQPESGRPLGMVVRVGQVRLLPELKVSAPRPFFFIETESLKKLDNIL